MQEQLRRYYLKQLGIDSYMPRYILSGAQPSVLCDSLPELVLDAARAESNTQANNVRERIGQESAGQANVSQAKASLDTVPAGAKNDLAPSVDKTSGKDSPTGQVSSLKSQVLGDDSRPVRGKKQRLAQSTQMAATASRRKGFHFNIWRCGPLLFVDSKQPRLALPTEKLLANIVWALGYREPLSRPEALRWPLDDNHQAKHLEAEGREMLAAYLGAQHERSAFTHLLLMGEVAAEFALSATERQADFAELMGQWAKVILGDCTVDVIALPGLAAMLQRPELKRITWRAIRPLCIST